VNLLSENLFQERSQKKVGSFPQWIEVLIPC
jgi:hypothetical protein